MHIGIVAATYPRWDIVFGSSLMSLTLSSDVDWVSDLSELCLSRLMHGIIFEHLLDSYSWPLMTESVWLTALLILVLFSAVCKRHGQEFIVQYLLAPSGCSLDFIILTEQCCFFLRYLALFLCFITSCQQLFRCCETLIASILFSSLLVFILVHNILFLSELSDVSVMMIIVPDLVALTPWIHIQMTHLLAVC